MLPERFGIVAVLLAVIVVSLWIGRVAQRAVERSSFVKSYFLGNRSLRSWALALTATVQSGGTFMGYPALVWAHGWVVALWIGAYMVVPITAFGVFAKRFAQLSRRTGAITVPDLFRERFASPAAGLLASLLILFFLGALMIAQFKAGAIVMQFAWDTASGGAGAGAAAGTNAGAGEGSIYMIGLLVFSLTVLAYTLMGGFLASVWTDLVNSILMLIGVLALLALALAETGGMEAATRAAAERAGAGFVYGPGAKADGSPWLPVGIALSMSFVWVFGGMGTSASLVRVMAIDDSRTLGRSIVILGLYNLGIYIPLLLICVAARAILPEGGSPDEVVPRMALWTTRAVSGGSWLAGLILAAPFGAVMATVSAYLVIIASGLVRDIWQRWIAPDASDRQLRVLTRATMAVVGAVAIVCNLRPVEFLQSIVVFGAAGQAAAFIAPAFAAAYWRRATAPGVIAAMSAGSLTVLALLVAGIVRTGSIRRFEPYCLLGLDPVVWGLIASTASLIIVSRWTRPPPEAQVARLFGPTGAPSRTD